ncbi:MAG: terminase small subunit [Clostridia bacterium]|nr:terminase small subunit [Clostridia bacterium]
MPKQNSKAEEAKKMYEAGKKLVEIAQALGVPPGTVRRWKSTYKWDGERSDLKSERSGKKSERSHNKINDKNKAVAEEVEQVVSNAGLTDKQRLFCIYYVRCFNAAKAYQKAYGVSYATAKSAGYRMLTNVRVKEEIMNLKSDRMNRELLTADDIFQKYIDIAFADMNDYLEWREEDVPVITAFGPLKDEKGNVITRKTNVLHFKDSNDVDGTIVSEVTMGNKPAVKLADRLKALNWLADHMDIATEKQKAEIELLRTRIGDDSTDAGDDGFIDALNAASEVWNDESG